MSEAHFNGLTPAQQERLVILSEGCSDVIKAVSKILRHGFGSRNPHNTFSNTNQVDLAIEMGNLEAAMERLSEKNDIDGELMSDSFRAKMEHGSEFTHHQGPTYRNGTA